ncbi:DoxX family protein [Streptomyces sp. NPDC057617]|uniref:DoxX family protein n=1 Tax=Streptomyces sp. NPDC057617 TaxID=3346184 RepID=UPI00367E6EC9
MSVDTRTPRPGFDDQPPLSMLKVDCDPAQVIVNHASFRVKLASTQRPSSARALADTARFPPTPPGAPGGGTAGRGGGGRGSGAGGGAGGGGTGGSAGRRRAPVVWSGKSAPGDPGASGLLQAVRNSATPPAGYRDTRDARAVPGGRPGGPGRPGMSGPAGVSGAAGMSGAQGRAYDAGATQVIPRLDVDGEATVATPVVGSQGHGRGRGSGSGPAARTGVGPLLPPMRQAVGAYDTPGPEAEPEPYLDPYREPYADTGTGTDTDTDAYELHDLYDDRHDHHDHRSRAQRYGAAGTRAGDAAGVRHAYYPGRRMNLGVVLLPLRVFLGFISIYAGMGKLCDPVYFDGGERGSMVTWLSSLHPWALAEPLRDFALSHPVGAGLSVAFLQIVVGVLTVLGLWQRVAACVGALLSAALLLTVSWRTVPAYDAPDIIYLAAWSPLIIAGAPVYSVDGRLAGEAWRTLGPRSEIWDLRRRVLRRGGLVATVVIGLTLLVGSVLGGAVRSSDMVTVPGPNADPVNQLPGEPLPKKPGEGGRSASGTPSSGGTTEGRPSEPSATRSGTPEAERPAPGGGPVPEAGGATSTGQSQQQQPSQTQGTTGRQAPQTAQQAPPPSSSQGGGPSTTGGGAGDGSTGASSGDGGGSGTGGSTSGGGNHNPIGGLLG